MKTTQSLLTLLCTVIVSLFLPENLCAIEPPISPFVLAEKLGQPRDTYSVKDLTEDARARRNGDAILSAHLFVSADKTSPELTLAIARPGLLWTEKFQTQIRTALEQARTEGVTNVPIRTFRFGTNGEGVYRLSGFGRDAMELEVTATFPAQARDIRLKAFIRNDAEDKHISDIPDTRPDELLRQGFALAGEAITGAPVEMRWTDGQEAPWQKLSPSPSSVTNRPATKAAKPVGVPTAPDSAATALAAQPSASKSWLLLLGFASFAAIAWFLLRGRGQ